MKKYVVIAKDTETVVEDNIDTRALARIIKKKFEKAKQEETGSDKRPSAYFVETDVDHPAGAGIYIH